LFFHHATGQPVTAVVVVVVDDSGNNSHGYIEYSDTQTTQYGV
jgi:hypothetical protein